MGYREVSSRIDILPDNIDYPPAEVDGGAASPRSRMLQLSGITLQAEDVFKIVKRQLRVDEVKID